MGPRKRCPKKPSSKLTDFLSFPNSKLTGVFRFVSEIRCLFLRTRRQGRKGEESRPQIFAGQGPEDGPRPGAAPPSPEVGCHCRGARPGALFGETSALTLGLLESPRRKGRRPPAPGRSGERSQRPLTERTEAPGQRSGGAAATGRDRRENRQDWPLPGAVAEVGTWSCDEGRADVACRLVRRRRGAIFVMGKVLLALDDSC